jgi:hypothetical protein
MIPLAINDVRDPSNGVEATYDNSSNGFNSGKLFGWNYSRTTP